MAANAVAAPAPAPPMNAAALLLKETKEADDLYELVKSAPEGDTTPHINYLRYVLTTNHYITSETLNRVREVLTAAIASKNPQLKSDGLLAKICNKLKERYKFLSIKGCPAKHTLLGKGTYGAVISPALNNIDPATGNTIKYPYNVTKIFFEKQSPDPAEVAAGFSRMVGNTPYIKPYTKEYTLGNIHESIAANLRNKGAVYNMPLQLVRMPNMGKSISKIAEFYKDVRENVPAPIMIHEIGKLIGQLAKLNKQVKNNSGEDKTKTEYYSHTDIRPDNVMLDPKTGTLQIIDYDWLSTYRTIYNEYPFGFYSNPPECLIPKVYLDKLIKSKKELTLGDFSADTMSNEASSINGGGPGNSVSNNKSNSNTHSNTSNTIATSNSNTSQEQFIKLYNAYINLTYGDFAQVYEAEYIQTMRADEIALKGSNSTAYWELIENKIKEDIAKGQLESIKFLREEGIESVENIYLNYIIPSIDGFGLGMTLRLLLIYIYPGIARRNLSNDDKQTIKTKFKLDDATYNALRNMYNLLTKMSSLNLSERPSRADAAAEAAAIVAAAPIEKSIGGMTRRARKKTRKARMVGKETRRKRPTRNRTRSRRY